MILRLGLGFPGGSVMKNLPATAGDTGSIPDPGRSHASWINKVHASQLLSLRSGALEPQPLSPHTETTEPTRRRGSHCRSNRPTQTHVLQLKPDAVK